MPRPGRTFNLPQYRGFCGDQRNGRGEREDEGPADAGGDGFRCEEERELQSSGKVAERTRRQKPFRNSLTRSV